MVGVADEARARPPRTLTPTAAIQRLRVEVGLPTVPLEVPPSGLSRTWARLDHLAAGGRGQLRVLQLGDSHIAADLISGAARAVLQDRFGDAGRGLCHADQRWGFGGRRLKRPAARWARTRVVEPRGPGHRYGLFGVALESTAPGAWVTYRVLPEDRRLEVHHEVGPGRADLVLSLDGKRWARISGRAKTPATRTATVGLPGRAGVLRIRTTGPRGRLYGLGFYRGAPGVVWSPIGPVGADARVFLQLEPESFRQDLVVHDPHLVVLMVGGNDALKVRKRWRSLAEVEADLRRLVDRLEAWLPEVEVVVMAPMDAGRRSRGRVVSKRYIEEVRAFQRSVAAERGLAFWDTLAAMGGPGSVALWHRRGLMARDLVHPRGRGADILGYGLGEALVGWYQTRGPRTATSTGGASPRNSAPGL